MRYANWALMFAFVLQPFLSVASSHEKNTVVGSKIFTESYVLGEIAAQALESIPHETVSRKLGMGSTGILFESLKNGTIDLYPDYSGTLAETILKNPNLKSVNEIRKGLEVFGLTISNPIGFNNTYALAVREDFAELHHLSSMSDLLAVQSQLRVAFSYEFMDRADGYLGMIKQYRFQFKSENVRRMEHSLVYQAMDQGAVDLIEVYSTDANIKKYHLKILKDDLQYFPAYQGVWVARLDFVKAHSEGWKYLQSKTSHIDEAQMRNLNASADIDKKSFPEIASKFLGIVPNSEETRSTQIASRTKEHLFLVSLSLLFSVLVGIPLGITASRLKSSRQLILITSAVIQTIPALALLCFLIPVFGVGIKPALAALCLYSLLPVVLNTYTGIQSIDPKHLENARALGLSELQILVRIILPLASPLILAGVKTSLIVSIGTATLAALVGAGGYGALIVSGLSLNDVPTILMGAVPAALMALLSYALFEGIQIWIVPKGLRNR